jgi:alkylation response protein AidB-like acyl-CoA dehydrogenase
MIERLFSENDRAIIETAREFARTYFDEESVSRWYKEGGMPDSLMRAYRESGLGYVGLPKAYGGVQVSYPAKVAIIEEFSRAAGTALPLQSHIYSFNIISKLANESQMELIIRLFEETGRPCFSTAISDALSGSDIAGATTAVIADGDTLRLSGQKAFVTNGEHAPYIMVAAKDMTATDDIIRAPFSLWLIPANLEGITTYPLKKFGQGAINSAAIVFENVHIQPEWRLESPNAPKESLERVMEFGRCIICASSLGMAQAAMEDAARYANQRVIRNRRLGEFGQIALMLTDMQIALTNMRSHVYFAASRLEQQKLATLEVSLMKKYVPAAAVEVADTAMQIFGGVGYTDSTRVSRIWADCRGNQFATGTDQVMVVLAARKILKKYGEQ